MILEVADVGVGRFIKTLQAYVLTALLVELSTIQSESLVLYEQYYAPRRNPELSRAVSEKLDFCSDIEKCTAIYHLIDSIAVYHSEKFVYLKWMMNTSNKSYIHRIYQSRQVRLWQFLNHLFRSSIITPKDKFYHGRGFRSFLFFIGPRVEKAEEFDGSEFQLHRMLIENEKRKLFRLVKVLAVPRGASGRLSTTYGPLASSKDQYEAQKRLKELL